MSDPKPGDRVTPENVASLPIGTIVRWTFEDGEPACAIRVGADEWLGCGNPDAFDDEMMSRDGGEPTAFVVYIPAALGIVDEGVPS